MCSIFPELQFSAGTKSKSEKSTAAVGKGGQGGKKNGAAATNNKKKDDDWSNGNFSVNFLSRIILNLAEDL